MAQTITTRLNITPGGVPPVIHLSRYDAGQTTLVFDLYDDTGTYTEIPSGSTVTIRGTKADKTGFEYECTFSGLEVSVTVQDQMTVFPGKVEAEIRITTGTYIHGTQNFILMVERATLDDDTAVSESDLPLIEQAAQLSAKVAALEEILVNYSGAGVHNSLYRGKNLGTSVTDAQYQAISDGTFDDLYIGDYWTISGINYRIGGFDYYLRCGDSTDLATHHAVIVPDVILYSASMNSTNTTSGGYAGSEMYTTNLEQAKTTIKTDFADHVLSHRIYLTNAVSNGKPSAGGWYDSEVDLMCEQMVYGGSIFAPTSDGSSVPTNHRVEKSQLPLFRYRPDMISNRQTVWLRDVVSGASFAHVNANGYASSNRASYSLGVRPAFCIY